MLDNVPDARALAEAGELALGTIDSWLIWNFTQGELHLTDVTNASRTMLFNIHTLRWDEELLALFGIPASMLPPGPAVERGVRAHQKPPFFASKIPLAGNCRRPARRPCSGSFCTRPGMVKNTYGTGCFLLMNTGSEAKTSRNNLLTTVAWQLNGQVEYALEGSIFMAGAVVQWLRDNLGIIKTAAEVEQLARQVSSTEGVCFVPAFAGLGAPHWDPYARGTLFGMSRATTAAHIARAAVEAIAFQTMDVLRAMQADSGLPIAELRVDGGASANDLLMQFQADVLDARVIRPPRHRDHRPGRGLPGGPGRRLLAEYGRVAGPRPGRYHLRARPRPARHCPGHCRLAPRRARPAHLVGAGTVGANSARGGSRWHQGSAASWGQSVSSGFRVSAVARVRGS